MVGLGYFYDMMLSYLIIKQKRLLGLGSVQLYWLGKGFFFLVLKFYSRDRDVRLVFFEFGIKEGEGDGQDYKVKVRLKYRKKE